MLIEVSSPLTVKLPSGAVHLVPGQPVELSDEQATRLLAKAGHKVRVCAPTIQAGSQITWTRGDLTVQHGTVDFVHVDDAETRWAFVTLGESWAAVPCTIVKAVAACVSDAPGAASLDADRGWVGRRPGRGPGPSRGRRSSLTGPPPAPS